MTLTCQPSNSLPPTDHPPIHTHTHRHTLLLASVVVVRSTSTRKTAFLTPSRKSNRTCSICNTAEQWTGLLCVCVTDIRTHTLNGLEFLRAWWYVSGHVREGPAGGGGWGCCCPLKAAEIYSTGLSWTPSLLSSWRDFQPTLPPRAQVSAFLCKKNKINDSALCTLWSWCENSESSGWEFTVLGGFTPPWHCSYPQCHIESRKKTHLLLFSISFYHFHSPSHN